MIYPRGTLVTVLETVKRYGGRKGRIITDNALNGYVEIGISFGKTSHIDAWFLPTEVEDTKSELTLITFPNV